MKKLAEKVAFVTGGSRGIGAGIAKRLAAEGAKVVITYAQSAEKARAVVDEIKKAGGEAMAIAADNTSVEAVTAAVEKAAATYGRIDILVNNAGIFVAKPITDLSVAEYEETMAVNVRAVFVASQVALRFMNDDARIIIIGSNMAERVDMQGGSLYAMSKSALIGLTKGMARDLGARGITVNLVQPGPIDTDMNPANSEIAEMIRRNMAIPHYGKAEDVAGLVAYLASAEGRFMTGAALMIDGGYSV
jgi:3-oxoacyl-[acyl-carrier protein] reductase